MDWNKFTEDLGEFAGDIAQYGMWTAIVYFIARALTQLVPIIVGAYFGYKGLVFFMKKVTEMFKAYLKTKEKTKTQENLRLEKIDNKVIEEKMEDFFKKLFVKVYADTDEK